MAHRRLTITIDELKQAFEQLPEDGHGKPSYRIPVLSLREGKEAGHFSSPNDGSFDERLEFIWSYKDANWKLLSFNVDIVSQLR